jgi:hypothetical protein
MSFSGCLLEVLRRGLISGSGVASMGKSRRPRRTNPDEISVSASSLPDHKRLFLFRTGLCADASPAALAEGANAARRIGLPRRNAFLDQGFGFASSRSAAMTAPMAPDLPKGFGGRAGLVRSGAALHGFRISLCWEGFTP